MKKGKKLSIETKNKISNSCKNAIVVHHINGNHFDDRPENRMLLTTKEHAQLHIIQGNIKPYGGGLKKGCIGLRKGIKHSKKTCRQLSLRLSGRKLSESHKQNLKLAHKRRTYSIKNRKINVLKGG